MMIDHGRMQKVPGFARDSIDNKNSILHYFT